MGAIHELSEDLRRYRHFHPEYRWLFLLLDIAVFFFNLALFAGFVFVCWYIINRSAVTSQPLPVVDRGKVTIEEIKAPELSDERIALLKSIANPVAKPVVQPGAIPAEISTDVAKTASPDPSQIQRVELVGAADGIQEGANISTASLAPLLTAETEGQISVVDSSFTPPEPRVQLEALRAQLESTVQLESILPTPQPEPTAPITEVFVGSAEYGAVGRDWILNQYPDHYTVQIALTVNRPFLVGFAKQMPKELISAIYPERLNGKGSVQYSLTVGDFADEQAAEAFLASLPAKTRRYGAHLRTFSEIQQNVSQLLSSNDIR